MKDKLKRKILLFVLLLMISSLVPISLFAAAAPKATKPKPEGTLIAAFSMLGAESFLPDRGGADQALFWEVVYDYLGFLDGKTMSFKPGLAKRFEMSKDARTLTIWLRDDVQWHGGWGKVTADDVKYTYELLMSKGSISQKKKYFTDTIGSIKVVDSYSLVVNLKKPDPTFWLTLTMHENVYMPIICKKYVETVGEDKAMREPVGSGPYRLVEAKLGDYLKFEAFDEHWRVVPEFKYLIIRLVSEETTRVAMLKSGDIDITQVPSSRKPQIEKEGLRVLATPRGYMVVLYFGGTLLPEDKRYVKGYQRQDPWKDPRVREAMNIAIDRAAIAKAIYFGTARSLPIHVTVPGWEELEPIPYDPKRAKELLAKAGYPDGFSLTIRSTKHTPGVEIPEVTEAVAGYWEKIGLKPRIVMSEWSTVRNLIASGKSAGLIWAFRQTHIEDWSSHYVNYYTPGGSFPQYHDEGMIDLLRKKVIPELNWEKRTAAWREVAKYERDNYLSIPIAIVPSVWGVSKKVGEWPLSPGKYFNLVYIRHAKPLNTWRLFTP